GLPWLVQSHSWPGSWSLTEPPASSEPPPGDTRAADFEGLFAPVPDEVWTDRQAPLADESLREIAKHVQAAGMTSRELRAERARLGNWLDAHRANTLSDLPGAWHGLRRLIDGDVNREYETNRRKRKLLGQLLASAAD
ncbi:MAG TPA: hypothetical protein VML55_04625, partial [Planctomycetaceae bacterium]|nr:hypothetical protein [Planctomycetaceae bacterium]